MCKLSDEDGLDVMLLQLSWEVLGQFLNASIVQQNIDIPNAEERIQQPSPAQYAQSIEPCVPTTVPGTAENILDSRGKIRGR
jgi:hypothetical protein